MKNQLEMAQLILRYDIRALEANINSVREYLQVLQPQLQSAKQYETNAKAILEEADALVKENEEMEKADPSLRQEKDWHQVVLVALEAQCDALNEHEEARQNHIKIQEKHDKYSKKLQQFETEHRERVQLRERLSSKKPSVPIKKLSQEEELSFLKTKISLKISPKY